MKNLSKRCTFLTVFSYFLCAFSVCLSAQGGQSGQSSIITEITRTQAQLTAAQEAKISKLEQLDYVEEIRIVNVQDLSQAENKGYLNLLIPGTVNSHNLQITRIKYANDNDYTISGELITQHSVTGISSWGYFSIVATAHGQGGYFHIDGEFYSLFPIDATKCLWIKGRPSEDKPDCLSTSTSTSTSSPNPDFCEDDNDCVAEVRVMVLITPEAEAFFSIDSIFPTPFSAVIYAAVGIESTNVALRRSEVFNKEISYFYEVVDFISLTTDINLDVDNLATHPQIEQLREDNHADLVVMLTDDRYATAAGAVNNFGCIEEHCAYAIVEAPEMFKPRWTFAHEVGHLLGARHNRSFNGGNDDTDICAHGFRFNDADGVVRKTLHARLSDDNIEEDNQERILNYSNADVSFNGAPTGELRDNGESFAENAQFIKHGACVVATHFPPLEWSVYIDGPNKICQPFSFFYASIINEPAAGFPGQAPYTYEWRWSLESTDNGTFLSNDTSIPISIISNSFLFNYEEFFLILTVTSSDGHTFKIRKKVLHPCAGPQNLSAPSSTDINASQISVQQKTADFVVYPTVSSGHINIAALMTGMTEVTLLDLNGNIVQQTKLFIHATETTALDISKFPTGSYFIRLTSDTATSTLPLFLIQP